MIRFLSFSFFPFSLSFLFFTMTVGAQYVQYQPISMDFKSESTSESANINPFTDYRLQVTFSRDDQSLSVPGFYADDGNAAV